MNDILVQLYNCLLHQQIWNKDCFYKICSDAGLKVLKFKRLSEYTQAPSFYLDNMGIKNPFLRLLGNVFVFLSPLISKNKIMSVIVFLCFICEVKFFFV